MLEPHVVPFAPYSGSNSYLVHDNARHHIDNIVQNYLNEVGIRFFGVARSKPSHETYKACLEPYWMEALQNRKVPSKPLEDLETAVTEKWNQMSPDYIGDQFTVKFQKLTFQYIFQTKAVEDTDRSFTKTKIFIRQLNSNKNKIQFRKENTRELVFAIIGSC
ncbi:hypothetical protein QE152_g33741 [Popillia japonica]|uniref:Transposase n=1 Tax=Popillia japonica TaxID=7064 RepID=A0AAW1IVV0_POPJA